MTNTARKYCALYFLYITLHFSYIAIFQNKFQENIDNKTRILYNGVEIKTKRSAIYGN